MKKDFLEKIGFGLLLSILALTAAAQTPVFSYDAQGFIVPNTKYIQPFCETQVYPLEFVDSMKLESPDKQYHYTVKLYNYKGWAANSPGDFRVIDVCAFGRTLIRVINEDAWIKLEGAVAGKGANEYFQVMPLKDDGIALCFYGYPYASTPGLLTIVAVNGRDAKVVHNSPMKISAVEGTVGSSNMKLVGGSYVYAAEPDKTFSIWPQNGVLYEKGWRLISD
ncbi:MAG: hypothetical protein IJC16_00845 [Rikenellaceae bacterium]|nr:hypothetical protein [Rikenellaceae bacterium]